MVNLVEDWEILEEYGERCGVYQLLDDGDAGKIEIRVLIGGCGFIKEFDNSNDEALKRILDYCRRHGFVKLSENVRIKEFFK